MANITTTRVTPNISQPGVAYDASGNHGGLPFLNAEGSAYATTYSKATTDLISKAIEREIFDTVNEKYAGLYTFMYNKASQEVTSDEFDYKEKVFGRNALTVTSWNDGTGVVTLTGTYAAANEIGVAPGDVVALPNNKKAIVTTVTWSAGANASTITLVPYTGGSFAAGDMAATDTLALESAAWTDGMNTLNHYDRMQVVDRYNNVQFFHRARRWGAIEMQKFINNATTNYMSMDKENSLEQLKNDMLATYLNGTYGQVAIPGITSGSYLAKMTNGVYPTMVAAGAASASVTTSGLVPALKSLAFATNRLASGKTRVLLGTDEMLDEVAGAFKNPIDYAPNDMIANLKLSSYEFGSIRIVPVEVPQMGDNTVLPSFFKRKLICLDMNAIQPVHMKGFPRIMINETPDITSGANTNMYKDWFVTSQFGLKFNAPTSAFSLDVL